MRRKLNLDQAIKRLLERDNFLIRDLLLRALPEDSNLRKQYVQRTFHIDKIAAKIAYKESNDLNGQALSRDMSRMIDRAVEFDYLSWPRRIRGMVRGKDILDVGCGTGLHAVGYLVVGAVSYTGLDPKINLDSDLAKNIRARRREHFGWTPTEMMQALPNVRLIPGTFEDMVPNERFDVVVLHNVTEHLLNLEDVFKGVQDRLRPDGIVIYNHHNFYCWNGHHMAPKFVDEIDPSDPKQQSYVDWNHLSFEIPKNHYFRKGLNRIRLDDLRTLTERYFTITEWTERLSNERQGLQRLTPEIMARHPELKEREFKVQNVFCVASLSKAVGNKLANKPSSRERDMRRDPVFLEFYERCQENTMTTMERLYGLYSAVEYIVRHRIPGDFVECGVWRGGSMMMAALALQHFGDDGMRKLYLYDTYEGMTKPSDADRKFGEGPAEEKWEATRRDSGSSWNFASLETVEAAMKSTEFPAERTVFVKGLVEETLPSVAPEQIAILRLDTDFYVSTLHELMHLYPRLSERGVLIVDDYGTWAGAKQAVDEYFEQEEVVMLLSRLDAGGRMGVKQGPLQVR